MDQVGASRKNVQSMRYINTNYFTQISIESIGTGLVLYYLQATNYSIPA